MAEMNGSDSEGSDFDVDTGDFDGVNEDEVAADPLDRVQAVGGGVDAAADGNDPWLVAMFGDDDDDQQDFLGFQDEWITDPTRFTDPHVPRCLLQGGSREQFDEDTSAVSFFNILWNDEVNLFLKLY